MDENLLEIRHFSQVFGKFKAVDDVSFSVKKGEVFGLVGESGCGKTTTGRAIVGLLPVTEGEILFEGKPKQRRNTEVQMIFQDPMASLDPRMTVREIIAEGLRIKGIKNKTLLDEKVYAMMALVGLSREQAGRYPHEFSGGQRQRIGIARALVMEPKLLIVSEPTRGIDIGAKKLVLELLAKMNREQGMTIIMVSSELNELRSLCDRIAIVSDGKLTGIFAPEASDAEYGLAMSGVTEGGKV